MRKSARNLRECAGVRAQSPRARGRARGMRGGAQERGGECGGERECAEVRNSAQECAGAQQCAGLRSVKDCAKSSNGA